MNQPTEDKQIYLLADLACRLAAIDIGSNSVRLLIAEALRGSAYRILDEERVPTRLGRAVSSQGRLDDESMEQTIAALRTFKEIAAGYQVTSLRTIATCAVRESRNGPEFCRRVREQVGLDVEVISGEREARLAFTSVQHAFDLGGKNVVVADIGGGSTEIVFATGNLVESIFSTPLGAVRLTEQFGLGEGAEGPDFLRGCERLEEEVATVLKKRTTRPLFAPHFLVGCGGTFTTLADLMTLSLRQDFRVDVRWQERRSRDTWENARFSADILLPAGITSVYVVTHAWHMRRALLAFEGTGLRVTAAPTPLLRPIHPSITDFIPSVGSLATAYFAVHEWVGLLWYSWRH